jgi:hypothetical protein
LTNFSVNKKNSIFKADDGSKGEGYKWSFETLKLKFEELGIDWRPIFVDIEDIVVKTFLSIESTLFTA